jgi:3-hydroxyacyl-[acyl-carrier-protein] dehydratase
MVDITGIMKVLPHRYPFLLVDRILELEPGVRALGIKNITANEPQFTGHWPGSPVMPGVLMVEAMAQVGGMLVLTMKELEGRTLTAFMAGLDEVRFRRKVVPGDQLVIEAIMTKMRGLVGRAHIVAKVEGDVAVEGEFIFALVEEKEEPEAPGSV